MTKQVLVLGLLVTVSTTVSCMGAATVGDGVPDETGKPAGGGTAGDTGTAGSGGTSGNTGTLVDGGAPSSSSGIGRDGGMSMDATSASGPGDASPRPSAPSVPSGPVDPSCKLAGAAFCDNFDKASPGGRGGDLDDNLWSFARLGFSGGGQNFGFVPTPIDLCGKVVTVPHHLDSQFCKTADGDPRWAEAFHDGGSFVYNAGRIRQPFDFAGRTGIVQFEVDARNSGTHGWWTEVWITDAPIPGPNHHDPQLVSSKEAIGIALGRNCGPIGPGTTGAAGAGVNEILVTRGYVGKPIDFKREGDGCVRGKSGSLNLVQIRLSATRVEVWASDEGSREVRLIASGNVSLGFSRGYVHLTHVHYNASKAGGTVTNYQTYQWARAAFDGPRLPAPRGYGLPDSLTPMQNNALAVGYAVSNDVTSDGKQSRNVPADLRFMAVNTTGATGARLTFNTVGVKAGDVLRYRLNGKEWRTWQVPAELVASWERQGFSVPVAVSELVPGDNKVEFGTNSRPFFAPASSMYIANIDLEVEVQ